jgi:2-dehydro-3-deoxyphosphogluconate aldolase/(4S)-4-hydroxy-2-oxoglutarate aldolase
MLNKLTHKKIVPVTVIEDAELAAPLAETLLEAGLDVIEITFRTGCAAESVKRISEKFPEMLVGAGTLLNPYQVDKAMDAGAKFAVTPGTNPQVVEYAHGKGLPLSPGVITPSEIEKAIAMGCSVLKFFPAEAAGGASFLKALAGPYQHTGVKFIPTGGINLENMKDYLRLHNLVAGVGGSWMVDKKLIKEKNWTEIKERTQQALERAATD